MTTFIGSETDSKAKGFLSPIKEVMSGRDPYSWFSYLYGNWYARDRAWSDERVIHAYRKALGFTEPSFGTYSLDKGITGYHPLFVVLDDPSSLETLSETTLAAARSSYDSTWPALRTDSFFLGVMTPYAENDATGHALGQDGVAEWAGMPHPDPRYTAEPEGKIHVYFLRGRDTEDASDEHPKGRPVLPAVWDEEGLTRYEKRDPINYAAQIMCTPSIGEHMPLARDQIDTMWINRDDLPPMEYATLHCDTAFSDERQIAEGDASVIVTVLHDIRDNGHVYIDHVWRSTSARSEQFVTALIGRLLSLRARGYWCRAITDEKTIGGHAGIWRQHLETAVTSASLRCPEILLQQRGGTKKVKRIREAAAYWAEGYVKLVRGADNIDSLVHEMLTIGRTGTHDDCADAASDIWVEGLWRKPHDYRARDEGTHVVQPGDADLQSRRVIQLRGDALNQRLQEMFPWGRAPRSNNPDDAPINDPIR